MKTALRGINLGGWLLVERWMTPEVFDGVQGPAEVDIVRELGYEAAKERLTRHRDTFITKKDFIQLKKQGFDFVRLPVGYWLFQQADDFIDGEAYLKQAFRWAAGCKLGVVLDFHGLQGSQNGKDHSGQVGKMQLHQGDNEQLALKTLRYMAKTYGQEPALIGLEIINEPKAWLFLGKLIKYYDNAYETAHIHLAPNVKIIVSDAFMPKRMARRLSRRPYAANIVLDIHLYQTEGWWNKLKSFRGHVKKAEDSWADLLDTIQRYVPVMVGEWSAALPPRAYMDGKGSESERVSTYYDAQKRTLDNGSWAHAYWTYKAPHCGVWDWQTARAYLER